MILFSIWTALSGHGTPHVPYLSSPPDVGENVHGNDASDGRLGRVHSAWLPEGAHASSLMFMSKSTHVRSMGDTHNV